ncbi:MAG: hypothetical protein ABF289_19580 [Clostridiales bacterium]
MEFLLKLEKKLEYYFIEKGPIKIPAKSKSQLTIILPIIAIISLLFYVISVLSGLVITFSSLSIVTFFRLLTLLICAMVITFIIVSLIELFKLTKKSWNFLFYANLSALVYFILNFITNIVASSRYFNGAMFTFITSTLISFIFLIVTILIEIAILYFMFQLKDQYKN